MRILSYNIHKGFSGGWPRFTLSRIRDAIRVLQPDLIFLQEVHGTHKGDSQFQYLAEELWPHFAYGKNSVYTSGHHGNAILSRFPIVASENLDISLNSIERRGILHAVIQVDGYREPVHALCTHLGLLGWHRARQLSQLVDRVETSIPVGSPLIAAGDFNDWRKKAATFLETRLELREAFTALSGSHARTFPSWLPMLCLDRIYFRGFKSSRARTMNERPWISLSDHLALWAELEPVFPLAGHSVTSARSPLCQPTF